MPRVDAALAARLHRSARADRWDVTVAAFAEALERSAGQCPAGDAAALARYLDALHLEDLALACACLAGNAAAWDHVVAEYRPALYRAGEAIDRTGGGRELADSLWAELYGVRGKDGSGTPLFRYFHGRSALGTWLRTILAQRHVDALRARRRLDPLPDDDPGDNGLPLAAASGGNTAPPGVIATDRQRFVRLIRMALTAALGRLPSRDRLRLGWYYAQEMTLARIGRLLGEHEATVSRHLARTRTALRLDVEASLRDAGLAPAAIDECFAAVAADPGDLDLAALLPDEAARKASPPARSTTRGPA
jgi:RNA polymerase sigma-70 factor (ECF subfamily)